MHTEMAVNPTAADVLLHELSSATWGCTHLKVHKFRYTWTIDNFSCHPQEINNIIESPVFTVGTNNESTYRLSLCPTSSTNKDFVSIHLKLLGFKTNVRSQLIFYVISNKIETFRKSDDRVYVIESSYGYAEFIERKRLFDITNGYLIDDKLTIVCEGNSIPPAVNISGRNIASPFNVPNCMALNNLGLRFNDQKFSDVTFNIQGRELRAHKVILAAQSPVFSAMFEHEMTEQKENRVEIEDIDFEVFELMLRFIYTGKADINNKMADRLLMAADKYQLDRLKVMCANKLASTLLVDSAIDILIIADLHGAHQLKALAMEFIVLRSHEYTENPQFKLLLQEHPLLGAETFRALAEKRILEIPNTKE